MNTKTCKDQAVCEGTPEVMGEVFSVEDVMEVQGKPQVSREDSRTDLTWGKTPEGILVTCRIEG